MTMNKGRQNLILDPGRAWCEFIRDRVKPGWMEDSGEISADLPLSKRELFGLILLAALRNHQNETDDWCVGYDPADPEPNDGFVSDGATKQQAEHKLVPQMAKKDPLDEILSTYSRFADKGDGYGGGRTLIVYGNKSSVGMIPVSNLRNRIRDESPFEEVLLMHLAAWREPGKVAVFHVTQHYPSLGLAEIEFDLTTGAANVSTCNIPAR